MFENFLPPRLPLKLQIEKCLSWSTLRFYNSFIEEIIVYNIVDAGKEFKLTYRNIPRRGKKSGHKCCAYRFKRYSCLFKVSGKYHIYYLKYFCFEEPPKAKDHLNLLCTISER